MVDVLREAGFDVITSDTATYRRSRPQFDFLDERQAVPPRFCDANITNPPYHAGNRIAVQFARLALTRCSGFVALLLTAKIDLGSTRVDLFRDNPRFLGKIALVDRVQWFRRRTPGDGRPCLV